MGGGQGASTWTPLESYPFPLLYPMCSTLSPVSLQSHGDTHTHTPCILARPNLLICLFSTCYVLGLFQTPGAIAVSTKVTFPP